MNVYQPVMPPLEDLPIQREKDPVELENQEDAAAWRCRICGYVHNGDEPPNECPYCFFPQSAFKKV
jgi:acyl-CoA dehydrogenase